MALLFGVVRHPSSRAPQDHFPEDFVGHDDSPDIASCPLAPLWRGPFFGGRRGHAAGRGARGAVGASAASLMAARQGEQAREARVDGR